MKEHHNLFSGGRVSCQSFLIFSSYLTYRKTLSVITSNAWTCLQEFIWLVSWILNVARCSLRTKVPFGSSQRLQWYAWGQPADRSDNVTSYYLLPETKPLKAECGKAHLSDRARFCTLFMYTQTHTHTHTHSLYLSDISHTRTQTHPGQ